MPDPGPFFELSGQPMAMLSRDGRWLRVNPAFGEDFGWREAEVQGREAERFVHPDDHALLQRALRSDEPGEIALHLLTVDSDYRSTGWWITPDGADLLLCVGRVITDRDEDRMKAQVRHLSNEIEHRVRNSLAVIRSIIRRSGESFGDSEAFAHLQGRIDSFARVQSKLRVAGEDYRGVDLAALIEDELLAQSMREGEQLAIGGPDVALTAKAAEAIGLAVHELAMNSVKFGAVCIDGARVDVHWELEDGEAGGRLLLTWTESGVPERETPVRNDGFGMETLLRSLPYELGVSAQLEFRSDGLEFTMSAPLARIASPPIGG